MRNLSLLYIAFLLLNITAFAQAPDTMWTKIIGWYNQQGGQSYGTSVIETIDGGYVFTGYQNYFANPIYVDGMFLVKTDGSGNIIWDKSLYTQGCECQTIGRRVIQTSDGGFVVVGTYWDNTLNQQWDIALIKTNSNGDIEWEKRIGEIGSTSNSDQESYSVVQTNDNGFLLIGRDTNENYPFGALYLIKTDEFGTVEWEKRYGSMNTSWIGNSINKTNDGGYIISGQKQTFPDAGLFFWSKIDPNGDTLWVKTLAGDYTIAGGQGYDIQQTSDNGYIMTGDFGGGAGLIKTDSAGDTLWTKGFRPDIFAQGYSVIESKDGGYVFTGEWQPTSPDVFLSVIKTSANGNFLWQKLFGLPSTVSRGYSIQQTSDDGYIIVGETKRAPVAFIEAYLIKLAPDVSDVEDGNSFIQPEKYSLLQNFPNPFNPSTKVKYSIPQTSQVQIKVFDVLGNQIETFVDEEKLAGTYELTWSAANLPSGVYFYRLKAGSFIETKKMILAK